MNNNITTIFFDWGWTLHNPEADELYEEAAEVIAELSGRYTLLLVSLARSETPEARKKKIEDSGLAPYFNRILVGGEDKDEMYEDVLIELEISPEEVMVVDDRTVRGIAWGNRRGATTVWVKRGKYATELPTSHTGDPAHTITNLRELSAILVQ